MLLLGTGHCFRDHVLEVCPEYAQFSSSDAEGIRKTFEGSSLETIKYMVASGMGVTVVPQLSVPDETQPHIAYVPFDAAGADAPRRARLAAQLHALRGDRGAAQRDLRVRAEGREAADRMSCHPLSRLRERAGVVTTMKTLLATLLAAAIAAACAPLPANKAPLAAPMRSSAARRSPASRFPPSAIGLADLAAPSSPPPSARPRSRRTRTPKASTCCRRRRAASCSGRIAAGRRRRRRRSSSRSTCRSPTGTAARCSRAAAGSAAR